MTDNLAHVLPDDVSRHIVGALAARLPDDWGGGVARYWRRTWDANGRYHYAANAAARELVADLERTHLPLSADEDAIRARAATLAEAYRGMVRQGWRPTEEQAEQLGAVTVDGAAARLSDPQWWRRRLRREHGRTVEAAGMRLGLVRSSRQVYCTDASVRRRRQQKSRNRAMLEETLAVNELGEQLSLAEIADASVSNPTLRRGELMVRMAGMEWVAGCLGWVGFFLTLTAPSAFHPTRSYGRRIVDNPRYQGFTPREAQAWLCKVWARIRAAMARAGAEWFGFRVAEPHGDGTPHWHLLVFLAPEHVPAMLRICRKHALKEYGDEPGAAGYRFKAKRIDPSQGSAAGYIAKYVAKNIDGANLAANDPGAGDMFGRDPVALAERVDAWASTWGIRQFQQVGGPSVTVWRELRRMDWEEAGLVECLRAAADVGNWGYFMHLLRESGEIVRPARLEEINTDTGELPTNRYGEPAAAAVVGVECGGVYYLTRLNTWELIRKGAANDGVFRESGDLDRSGRGPLDAGRPTGAGVGAGGRGFSFVSAAHAAPWSPGNNCTAPGRRQLCRVDWRLGPQPAGGRITTLWRPRVPGIRWVVTGGAGERQAAGA